MIAWWWLAVAVPLTGIAAGYIGMRYGMALVEDLVSMDLISRHAPRQPFYIINEDARKGQDD